MSNDTLIEREEVLRIVESLMGGTAADELRKSLPIATLSPVLPNDTLIERIDEHIETGKSAGEWAEVNNAELVLLLTDIRAALSPVLPDEVERAVRVLMLLPATVWDEDIKDIADLLERLVRQVRDHTAYTESLEILHARIDELEKWQAKVFDVEPNIDLTLKYYDRNVRE